MNVQKIVIHKLLDLRNAIQDTWWSHAKIHNVSILSRPPVGSNGCSTSFFACLLMIFFLILYCGMVFNSMMSAFSNSCKELNGWWFSRIRLFSMSQTCSIGTRSGERLGQGNVLTLLDCKKFMERRAMCGRALSCWKRKRLFLCMNSTTTGHKMSSHRVF